MEDNTRLLFRRPLWQRVVPVVLLVCLWLVPAVLAYGMALARQSDSGLVRMLFDGLASLGITLKRVSWIAGFVSLGLLSWLYLAFEQLLVTPEAITRCRPFAPRRTMRWTDLDEVLIEHIAARFEGMRSTKKALTLYAARKRFIPWRKRMRISNRQFEGYHHVERIASQVSIPAIAARKRAEMKHDHKPTCFAERTPIGDLLAALALVGGIVAFALWSVDAFWNPKTTPYRPYMALAGLLLELFALRKFLFRQIGIDAENLYIMWRRWVIKTIPIRSIVDVRVCDNRMRILVAGRSAKPRVAFRTRRFIRNRGVLLHLLREAHEALQRLDAAPIVPIHPIEPPQESSPEVHIPASSPDTTLTQAG